MFGIGPFQLLILALFLAPAIVGLVLLVTMLLGRNKRD